MLFNTRDIAAANALLETSKTRWEELGVAIDDSKGSAEAMAEIQLDNLEGSVTKLKSAYEGLQIAIADKVTPAMQQMADTATQSMSRLTALISGNMEEYRRLAQNDWVGENWTSNSSGHDFYGQNGREIGDPAPTPSGSWGNTNVNVTVQNVETLDQLMDMIENDNRRRRMNP